MMGSESRWLLRELPQLVDRGIIETPVADRLRAHYGDAAGRRSTPILIAIFGVLGAMLVASGIILLLAHNWDDLSRGVRTGLAFAPLLVAQAVAIRVRLRRTDSRAWREGAASFLALTVIGGIALVSQIHQIPLTLGDLILAASVLSLPIVYLLDSRVTLTLYWIGITAWLFTGYFEIAPLDRVVTYWVLAGLTVPALLGLGHGRDGTPRLALPAWLISSCFTAAVIRILWGSTGVTWVVVLAGLVGAFYGAGSSLPEGERVWRPALRGIGALGALIGIVTLSYRGVWEEVMESLDWRSDLELSTTLAALGFGLALVAVAVPAGLRLLRNRRWHEATLTLAIVAVAAALLLALSDPSLTASMLTMNVYGLGLGLLACRDGLLRDRLGTANLGLLVASAILVARFFDVDWSFVVRGTGFVALGLVFLGVNLRLLARRREVTA